MIMVMAPSSPPHESSSSSSSSIPESGSIPERGTVEINRQLEELASKCGNFNNDVISLASQCQDLFESTCRESPHVSSLHTVLQAWSKTCATLAERRNSWGNGSPQPVYSDSGLPVYTARDAAERATQLLLEHVEERADALCIPDTACYNTVIGMYRLYILFFTTRMELFIYIYISMPLTTLHVACRSHAFPTRRIIPMTE
jgi:hypothetical protein